jgi:hypothetical protein
MRQRQVSGFGPCSGKRALANIACMSVVDRPPSAVARWMAAVISIVYGFAKINGSQFTVLDSELTRPLGEVSGFWLTWYYFGYSPVYGTLLALIQILSGILLVIPRTALAGALLLLPVATNIVLIDLSYGVEPGGTFAAVILTLCAGAIVVPYIPRLQSAVLLRSLSGRPTIGSLVALVVVMVGAFVFTWWTANVNNRAPTSIDGVWAVTSQVPAGSPGRQWRHVFFEYNRAHMAVFRAESGPDEQHHFEIDSGGVVRVWDKWLTKGPLIMEGRRTSETEVELVIREEIGGGRLLLRRVRPAL